MLSDLPYSCATAIDAIIGLHALHVDTHLCQIAAPQAPAAWAAQAPPTHRTASGMIAEIRGTRALRTEKRDDEW